MPLSGSSADSPPVPLPLFVPADGPHRPESCQWIPYRSDLPLKAASVSLNNPGLPDPAIQTQCRGCCRHSVSVFFYRYPLPVPVSDSHNTLNSFQIPCIRLYKTGCWLFPVAPYFLLPGINALCFFMDSTPVPPLAWSSSSGITLYFSGSCFQMARYCRNSGSGHGRRPHS